MSCSLPWGQRVRLSSPEEMMCTVGSNRPKHVFRLIFIGGGGTFQNPGPFGARGWPTGPTTGPVGLVWAPLGVHFGQVGP
jgi:hypothetical protein